MQNHHTTSTLGQEMSQLIEKSVSLYLFVYFFGTNYNIGELTNAAGCHTHLLTCLPYACLFTFFGANYDNEVPPGATPIN